jgi:phosphatidylinositol glycan class Q protein
MIAPNALMRIFWPTDFVRSDKAGVILGWRNSDLDMVVVTILFEVDVSLGDRGGRFRLHLS